VKILCFWLINYIAESYENCHYLPALKDLGHDVKLFPQEHAYDSKLLDIIALWQPDLAFFVPHKMGDIRPETYKYISDHTKTTTFAYFGDDEKEFDINEPWDSKHLCHNFNYIGTNHEPALKWYKKIGYNNAIYSQYGGYEKLFKPSKIKKEIPTSFIGSIKMVRVKFLNKLAYLGARFQVYGHGWTPGDICDEKMLHPKEYVAVINLSKINLDLNRDETKYGIKCQQIKGRDFEVPLAGGFLLCEYFKEIGQYYKLGTEIETFKDVFECKDKIDYYLKNESKREKIALAGRRRAINDHTYSKRFKILLDKLKLKKTL
jgi:spore maturation protein CgeB